MQIRDLLSDRRRVVVLCVLVALAILLFVVLALSTCGGGGGPQPSATPTETAAPTATPSATPIPPPPTAYRLVYQERGTAEDVIWRINPVDLSQKEKIAAIPHREGVPVEPSLSPDGRLLAYVSEPDFAIAADYQSELYIRDLKREETEKLADAVDLRFRPLWAPDSKLLYARRFIGQHVAVVQITVTRKPAPGEETPRPTPSPTPDPMATPTPTPPLPDPVQTILQANFGTILTFTPVGFADDNRSMYFVQVHGGTGGGTSVGAYQPATSEAIAALTPTPTPEPPPPPPEDQPTPTPTDTPLLAPFVVQLSDQVVRDFDFSPERRRLAYLYPGLVEGEVVQRVYVADLVGKTSGPLQTEGLPAGDHLHPVWRPDGQWLAVGLPPSGGGPGAVALAPVGGGAPVFLSRPPAGFDVPVVWVPDNSYLTVNSFSGDSPANPGKRRLDLLTLAGHRITVADGVDVEVVGWFKPEEPRPSPQ